MVLEELRGSRLTRACEPAQANDHHDLHILSEILHSLECPIPGLGVKDFFDGVDHIKGIDHVALKNPADEIEARLVGKILHGAAPRSVDPGQSL